MQDITFLPSITKVTDSRRESPDPEGTLADADAALEYLIKGREQDPGPVIVFGTEPWRSNCPDWVGNRTPPR